MSIDAVSRDTSTSTTTSSTTPAVAKTLGQDAFLKLLTTQLQHQDPTKPISDTEFIAQLATFSSLEKLSTIADSTTQLRDLFAEFGSSTTK
jgi:flagellar basal-body rod modification protein FlgD